MNDRRIRTTHGFISSLPLLALCSGLALTYASWQQARNHAQQQLYSEFVFRSEQLVQGLEHRFRGYQQILEDTASVMTLAPQTDKAQFHDYVKRLELKERFPGTLAIGYLTYVTDERLKSAQQQQRIRWPNRPLTLDSNKQASLLQNPVRQTLRSNNWPGLSPVPFSGQSFSGQIYL